MPLSAVDGGIRPLVKVNVEAKSTSGMLVLIGWFYSSLVYRVSLILLLGLFLLFCLREDTDVLERGLAKLSLADAAVEVTATAKGERIFCGRTFSKTKSI